MSSHLNSHYYKVIRTDETISLKQMVDHMDSGQPFSIAFRTCNKQKGTGGEYVFYGECVKHGHQTKEERKQRKESGEPKQVIFKNPNHYENSTRNIMRVSSGELVKVHLRLIRRFNNKIVL